MHLCADMLMRSKLQVDFRASESYFCGHTKQMTPEIEELEKARDLKDVTATFISLVKSPANRRKFVMKSDGQFEGEGRLMKYDAPLGQIYFVGYEPFVEDTQGDRMNEEEIAKMAHGFLSAGRTRHVDYEHNYNPEYGTIAESFILRGEDPMFPGVRKNSWVGMIQLSEAGKQIAKDVTGVSFAGFLPKKKSDEDEILKCRISEGHLAHRLTN
jgi:hypothetical protein